MSQIFESQWAGNKSDTVPQSIAYLNLSVELIDKRAVCFFERIAILKSRWIVRVDRTLADDGFATAEIKRREIWLYISP